MYVHGSFVYYLSESSLRVVYVKKHNVLTPAADVSNSIVGV